MGKTTNPNRVPQNAVHPSNIPTLTLHKDRHTTSRRGPAYPHLKCVSGREICDLHAVEVMQCTNMGGGYDAADVQWACRAELPDTLKLGGTDVICEGYESPDDPYVLKGSCGVEYRMVLTEKGLKRDGSERRGVHMYPRSGDTAPTTTPAADADTKTEWVSTGVFMVLFVGVLGIILWNLIRECFGGSGADDSSHRRHRRRRSGSRPDNNNNNGGGPPPPPSPPPYDDPPPYDWKTFPPSSPKRSQRKSRTTSTAAGPSGTRAQQTQTQERQENWRPGFWTGAAAAGAAAFYAGTRTSAERERQRQQRQQQQQETQQRQHRSSFWNRFTDTDTTRRTSAPPPPPPPPAEPFESTSTQFHQSTGFGETRRR